MRVCFSRVPSRTQPSAWEPWGPLSYIWACDPHREGRMIRRHKHGWLVVVLAGAALAACVQGEQQSQSADSTARNLTLAPTESTAALKDVPARATEAAKLAPEKKTPEEGRPAQARSADAGGRDPRPSHGQRLDQH